MRSLRKIWRSIGFLRPFARPHVKWMVRGTLATMAIVLLRLALPWPLKGVIDVVMPQASAAASRPAWYLPSSGDPVLWFVGFFVALALGVAVMEMIQRVCMAKFATRTFHDLRAAAVRGAARVAVPAERAGTGDLIARIIGDTARVKESLKGILIHASQHGLFYLGVWVVFMFISPVLSVFFLLGGVIAIWVGVRASRRVGSVFKRQRKQEGALATVIHQGLEHDDLGKLDEINTSSAVQDVSVTKLITFASLLIHVALAATTAAAVWFGTWEVRAGAMSGGELFLFITYALMSHHRIVQVGRQLARAGKVTAGTARLRSLVRRGTEAAAVPEGKPLATALRLEAVGLDSPRRAPRLDAVDLAVQPGSKVCVVGAIGSGKSSLLRLLAGAERADRGRVLWDDDDLSEAPEALAARVAFLPQEPFIAPGRVWSILSLPGREAPAEDAFATLTEIGAWKIVSRLPKGLRQRVSSATLSRNEARILRLGGILLGGDSVWLLDSPFQGMSTARTRRCLDEILKRAANRTLVVSVSRSVDLERFDRVIALKDGKILFDGQAHEWKERKLLKG